MTVFSIEDITTQADNIFDSVEPQEGGEGSRGVGEGVGLKGTGVGEGLNPGSYGPTAWPTGRWPGGKATGSGEHHPLKTTGFKGIVPRCLFTVIHFQPFCKAIFDIKLLLYPTLIRTWAEQFKSCNR